jgi:hypothetical protein
VSTLSRRSFGTRKEMMRARTVLLVVALATSGVLSGCASPGGFARGAYSSDYAEERIQLGEHIDRIVGVAKPETQAIVQQVRDLNAKEPGAGTGVLIGAILPRLASEVLVAGTVETVPAQTEGPAP